MTNKNAKPKRRATHRVQTSRDTEAVEALLAIERMENEASYRSRGRRLKSIDDLALKRLWVDCVIREYELARAHRTEMQDICAELSLRGFVQVELPPDLIELMTADIRKIMRSESGDSGLN